MIYESSIVWDGSFFSHEALTEEEAREWIAQYPIGAGCKGRIW